MKYEIHSHQEMRDLAKKVFETLQKPALVALEGNLGAGKTTFVKYFCANIGFSERKVKSPTFSLINIYRLPSGQIINHLDLYRLEKPDRFILEELKELLKKGEITFVEWGERLGDLINELSDINFYKIKFECGQGDLRTISFEEHRIM